MRINIVAVGETTPPNIDRADFICADDYPLTLADGIVIGVHDDPDGPLSAGEGEDIDSTEYVGVTVDDPETGAHDSLWSIGIPSHYSGAQTRAELWSNVIGPDVHDLLGNVRRARDHEIALRNDAAARDIVTVG